MGSEIAGDGKGRTFCRQQRHDRQKELRKEKKRTGKGHGGAE